MGRDQRKSVLVTGCSEGGIGDALAQEFHRRGLRVFATARNLAKVQHLKNMGIEVLSLDVEQSDSIRETAAAVGDLTGCTLDILVNNSGLGYNAAMTDSNIEDVKKMFNVNVFGLLEVTQTFMPFLIATQGQVVNVGSVAVFASIPFQSLYNASKAAVHSLSESMRLELAPFGVKVIYTVTGGIGSRFYDNSPSYDFPTDSIYDPLRKEVEPLVNGLVKKSMSKTSPEDFARGVVNNSLSWRPKVQYWRGSGVVKSWLGETFLWHSARDWLIPLMFGMSGFKSKLKKAGTKIETKTEEKVEKAEKESET